MHNGSEGVTLSMVSWAEHDFPQTLSYVLLPLAGSNLYPFLIINVSMNIIFFNKFWESF